MALITVKSPQPVTEVVCGVPFVEGVALVDPTVDEQRRALLYFTQAGYSIEKPAEKPKPPAFEAPPGAPSRAASKADWVAYVTNEAAGEKRLTAEQADALNRDQLAEHVLGQKGD